MLPVIFTVILVFLLVMPIIHNPSEAGAGIALITSGLPVYYFTIYRKDVAAKFSRCFGKCRTALMKRKIEKAAGIDNAKERVTAHGRD